MTKELGSNQKIARRHRYEIAWILVVSAAVVAGIVWLSFAETSTERISATFYNSEGTTSPKLQLAVASTPKTREKGLMFVKPSEIAADEGMLFVYPHEQKLSFWMRNTYTSLDMVFINKDKVVVGVVADIPILNDAPRSVPGVSMYVVELHAGSAKKFGIRAGSQLKVDGEFPVAREG